MAPGSLSYLVLGSWSAFLCGGLLPRPQRYQAMPRAYSMIPEVSRLPLSLGSTCYCKLSHIKPNKTKNTIFFFFAFHMNTLHNHSTAERGSKYASMIYRQAYFKQIPWGCSALYQRIKRTRACLLI